MVDFFLKLVFILLFVGMNWNIVFGQTHADNMTASEFPKPLILEDTILIQNQGLNADKINTGQSIFSSSKTRQAIAFHRFSMDNFPSPLLSSIYGMPLDTGAEIQRKLLHDDWKFYLTFILLALLALIRFGYASEFDELFTIFKNLGPTHEMFRELGTGVSFGTVLLNFFAVAVFGFYVFLIVDYFKITAGEPGIYLMVASLTVVSLFLVFRYLTLKIASLLLSNKKEIDLYNFYEIQINRSLGVILFPFTLFIAFSTPVLISLAIYISVFIIFVLLCLRYLKGFNIGAGYFRSHFFHFLLYICALEIAPLLIIIRLLENLGTLRVPL
jgi:hypothetical protein